MLDFTKNDLQIKITSTMCLSKLKCIYYQDLPLPSSRKTFHSDLLKLLDNVDEFVIRNDLIDCRIDICTSHVPLIFQRKF
ncbi:ATV_HP_G0013800.mRNA.1.CDS.1 [Saccharomyces cerevisiae]|nr:ATV_HP_G0013800.mRNA.1.CDS.1 [Saccharomyces cerevisiae]CAI6948683.1 ATV_HP_G0013800.mRNA.1.CDS.1 [Saccharomyces cerevisiae]